MHNGNSEICTKIQGRIETRLKWSKSGLFVIVIYIIFIYVARMHVLSRGRVVFFYICGEMVKKLPKITLEKLINVNKSLKIDVTY